MEMRIDNWKDKTFAFIVYLTYIRQKVSRIIVPSIVSDCFGVQEMGKVYALGYRNWKDLQGFVGLLKSLKVDVVVDARRFPTSKNLHFTGENLKNELPKHGIRYEYLGHSLGGFRKGGYQKYTETVEYKNGIGRLVEISRANSVAIMCVEPKSRHCHRRFIVQSLAALGIETIHME